jgi:hypothetical protein
MITHSPAMALETNKMIPSISNHLEYHELLHQNSSPFVHVAYPVTNKTEFQDDQYTTIEKTDFLTNEFGINALHIRPVSAFAKVEKRKNPKSTNRQPALINDRSIKDMSTEAYDKLVKDTCTILMWAQSTTHIHTHTHTHVSLECSLLKTCTMDASSQSSLTLPH